MNKDIKIVMVDEKELTTDQISQISELENICFSEVSKQEAEEDFYDIPVARILAYKDKQIVGCAQVHFRFVYYKGREILFGGPAGFCVKQDMRKKGIGTMLCQKAMEYLKENGCEVAFLSVSFDSLARILYRKFGFVDLPAKFKWSKSNGKTGEDTDGMLAPLLNRNLFNEIINSDETLYVGKGYW